MPPSPQTPSANQSITEHQARSRAARAGLRGWLVLTIASVGVGWTFEESAGAWAAVIASVVAGVFFGVTAIVTFKSSRVSPSKMGALILGSWLLKIVLLMVVLAWLRSQDFYHRPTFILVLLVQTFVLLTLESVVLTRAKTPYVEPLR